jgi:hypothetical protein
VRAALVVVVLVIGATACRADPAEPADDGLARLDAAVAAVDRGRSAVLDVPSTAVPVLTAYDDADAAAAAGDREAAAAARATAQAGRDAAQAALADLPARLAAYREALAELEAATRAARPLDSVQRTALATVAAGGRNEAAAVEQTGAAVQAALPAYDALSAALGTWLERARAGWYRSTREAAGGYAVLAAPGRPALEQARAGLLEAERRRTVEVDAQSARLADADAALASLRGPE